MRRCPLLAVALAIAASGSAPALGADLCVGLRLLCDGSEPNWQFTTSVNLAGRTVVLFTDPENPGWETRPLVVDGCLLQGSPKDYELTAAPPLSLVASITEQSCTLPNDEAADFSVSVRFVQGALGGNPAEATGPGCCIRLD
jgi:hypothetical protein